MLQIPANQSPALPSQAHYIRTGIQAVVSNPPQGEECTICFDDASTQRIVSITPCNHTFHQTCILKWFSGTQPARSSCPNCRLELFDSDPITSLQHNFQDMQLVLTRAMRLNPCSDLGALGCELNHRIQEEGVLPADVQEEFMVRYVRLRAVHTRIPGAVRTHHLPITPYAMNMHTEDWRLVNASIGSDLEALLLVARFEISDQILGETRPTPLINAVDTILLKWGRYGYPRSNFITIAELHHLTACAALIHLLNELPAFRPITRTADYAQFLAHADNTLLDAQRHAREADDSMAREYRRLLDHPDRRDVSAYCYPRNAPRVDWIVELRRRTRGPNADPMGPTPPQT